MAAWFETLSAAGFDPLVTALLAGFAVIGWDGHTYLTRSGERYLASLA